MEATIFAGDVRPGQTCREGAREEACWEWDDVEYTERCRQNMLPSETFYFYAIHYYAAVIVRYVIWFFPLFNRFLMLHFTAL
jgi:hypothetical protein